VNRELVSGLGEKSINKLRLWLLFLLKFFLFIYLSLARDQSSFVVARHPNEKWIFISHPTEDAERIPDREGQNNKNITQNARHNTARRQQSEKREKRAEGEAKIKIKAKGILQMRPIHFTRISFLSFFIIKFISLASLFLTFIPLLGCRWRMDFFLPSLLLPFGDDQLSPSPT
jgi:hypothetical protein